MPDVGNTADTTHRGQIFFDTWGLPIGSIAYFRHPNVKKQYAFTCRAAIQIDWNKRKCLHKKRVQLPQDWFGSPTWQKKVVYIRKELNSHRIVLVQQHGKRKCLHKKRVKLPQDWFGSLTWQKKVFT